MKENINYYKENIRKSVKAVRNAMSADDVMGKSARICSKLMQLKEFNEAKIIYAYMSINNEVSTLPVIEKLISENNPGSVYTSQKTAMSRLLLPRMERGASGNRMVFCKVCDIGMLSPGMMNIPEPVEECEIFDEKIMPALMIMPLIAFDIKCSRIGYGGGYYDKFIGQYTTVHGDFPGKKIGLAYECQLCDDIITDAHDISCDMVITENAIYEK